MRQLDEQWIENGRMYKAVEGQGCENCWGCHWSDENSCCDGMVKCPVNASETGLIVKDLGPVNEDGLLACPFCGSNLNIISCHDGFYARCCNNDCALGVTDSFVEKQDLIDACNRRN